MDKKLEKKLRSNLITYWIVQVLRDVKHMFTIPLNKEKLVRRNYKAVFGVEPNLDNPQTLNEKMQWLKLYDHQDFYTECADKFLVRNFLIKKFGEDVKEYIIPLFYETMNWRDITMDVLPNSPCIIKPTHTSGDYWIIKDKKDIDIKLLRRDCRHWLNIDYYRISGEWQYKNAPRRIIIEQLLQCKDGHIPNDYKLHYINGDLQFVYCSIGRETINIRKIYDAEWKPVPFSWLPINKNEDDTRGEDIPQPESFGLMRKFADEIAKMFDYVRVDFYDVDGKMYFGEITLYHGGGTDVFSPSEYDMFYGKKLKLTKFKFRK
jgi:hypothetical protein